MISVDIAVVGGGPAGAAAAFGLAAAGREVLLLERAAEPHHKVCGEFISCDTQQHLARLGIDPARLGAASLDRVSISHGSRGGSTSLPFPAWSLSRLRLDRAVLEAARRQGADIRTGIAIRAARPRETGWELLDGSGTIIRCRRLVTATGKLGLRGVEDRRDHSMIALKIHLRPTDENTRALRGRVELALLEQGYAGLELIEDGIANLCLLIRKGAAADIAPSWPKLRDFLRRAAPSLANRLADASPFYEAPITVACPAGRHFNRARFAESVYPVGDRLAHIPPFTGDGLGIAFGSAALAAECICRGDPTRLYIVKAQRLTRPGLRLAGAVSRLVATPRGRSLLTGCAIHMPIVLRGIAQRTRLSSVG